MLLEQRIARQPRQKRGASRGSAQSLRHGGNRSRKIEQKVLRDAEIGTESREIGGCQTLNRRCAGSEENARNDVGGVEARV